MIVRKFSICITALLVLMFFACASYAAPVWLRIVKSEHCLYVMDGGKTLEKFGVAVGKNVGNKQKTGDCRTPEGSFTVQRIQDARSWTHDFKDGKGAIAGAYGPCFIRLKTGWNGVGIHGTHDPSSIGTNATEGCIRLLNKNVDKLRKAYVRPGTKVVIEP